MAASRGFLEVVQYLVTLPVVDPAARNNKSIEMAADKEKWDIVRFLASLQGLDPRENNNELFIWLVSENMAVATKGLVKSKKINASIYDNFALITASGHGNYDLVVFLSHLPMVNDNDGVAAYYARIKGHTTTTDYLDRYNY